MTANHPTLDPALPDVFAAPRRAVALDPILPAEIFRRTRAELTPPPPRAPPSRRPLRRDGGLVPGTIIDKYRIEELLGVGGFAMVVRATHLLLGTTVALKLLRADVVARRPSLTAQLLQEARFAARIDHPNVVRIFDVTHTEQITYIVMEFIRGPSVARLIDERGTLSTATVVRIGIDVAAGLAAGLAQGLIHRDIKPANILLTSSGMARIVDLGLANPVAPGCDEGPLRDAALIGTRGYMAPEQLRDPRAADFRSDIYSLGITLREAATGVAPTDARGRAGAWPRAGAPELDRVLDWMAADDPARRPTSYAVLTEVLRAIRNDDGDVRP